MSGSVVTRWCDWKGKRSRRTTGVGNGETKEEGWIPRTRRVVVDFFRYFTNEFY